MRIISGKLRGRKLVDSSKFQDLRPTTDKLRESLFNILFSAKFLQDINFSIQDSVVLDLCCGTGAVAFEAISRGAKKAVLIDNNAKHLDLAKQNAQKFEIENQVEIIFADAKNLPQAKEKCDLVFIDPPYIDNTKKMVNSLIKNNWIDEKTLIVIEAQDLENVHESLKMLDSRQYGKSWFGFFSIFAIPTKAGIQ